MCTWSKSGRKHIVVTTTRDKRLLREIFIIIMIFVVVAEMQIIEGSHPRLYVLKLNSTFNSLFRVKKHVIIFRKCVFSFYVW